ncbi:MAG: hypothetical protein R6U19_08090 [Bacteroidales bacterium]
MNINRNNYETFMIDYLDGKLTPGQVAEVLLFLEQNPDIKQEVEGLHESSLPPAETTENAVFEDKAALKHISATPDKSINRQNYESWFIAAVEGTLTREEEFELNRFLTKNEALEQSYRQFMATKLKPEPTLVFKEKQQLKAIAITPVNGIDASNYESWMIAALEGELTSHESRNFNAFLQQNPGLEHEYHWFLKTKLKKDESLIYPYKHRLKKFIIRFSGRATYSIAATAAAIALLVGFSWNTIFPPPSSPVQIARLSRPDINLLKPLPTSLPEEPSEETSGVHKNTQMPGERAAVAQKTYTEKPVDNPPKRIDSYGQTLASVNPEMTIEKDYRIYIRNLYQLKETSVAPGNDVFMALSEDQNEYPAIERLAWAKIENWTGVKKSESFENEKKNLFWTALDMGISGINKLTGSQLKVRKKVSPEGEIQGYKLKNNRFEISRSR